MAGRIFLLRSAIHGSGISSSVHPSLPQISSFRSLFTSLDSSSPLAAAFHLLDRGYSTAELAISPAQSSDVSDCEEISTPVPPPSPPPPSPTEKKQTAAAKILEKLKKRKGGGKAAKSSPGKGGDVVSLEVMTKKLEVMTRKVRSLEEEVKDLKENGAVRRPLMTEKRDGIFNGRLFSSRNPQSAGGGLSSLFAKKSEKGGKSWVEKKEVALEDGGGESEVKLSDAAVAILERLRDEGVLNGVNLWKDGKVVPKRLRDTRIQNPLRSGSEKFAIEHHDIAQWLSASDMKKVALFGCPSVEKRSVHAAKKLRAFFSIKEDVVCGACKLKSSCKWVDHAFAKEDKLMLTDALRVLMAYSFYDTSPQIVLSSEMEESISKLLKEIVNLSK